MVNCFEFNIQFDDVVLGIIINTVVKEEVFNNIVL